MKIYFGIRISQSGHQPVHVCNENGLDFRPLLPEASQMVCNHSPDGFNWGYGGDGPAQLALGLLLDATDEETARKYYQDFKWDIVANWGDKWQITEQEIKDWVKREQGGILVPLSVN